MSTKQEPTNFTETQLNAEHERVVENLWNQVDDIIFSDGTSKYSVAKASYQDAGTFNRRVNEKGNFEIKTMIQTLMPFGLTIEIKIVSLK